MGLRIPLVESPQHLFMELIADLSGFWPELCLAVSDHWISCSPDRYMDVPAPATVFVLEVYPVMVSAGPEGSSYKS